MWSDEQAAGQSQVGYAARRTRSLRGLQMAAEGDDQRPLGQGLPSDSRQRATEARRYVSNLSRLCATRRVGSGGGQIK